MAEYQDDLALIVRYDGTKADFHNVRSNYKNKVVFIYGSKDAVENQAGLVQAIWVGDSNGGRYLDMANVGAIKDGLTHIAGFAIEDALKGITGANGINFKGVNGITIKLNPTTSTDKDGVPYWTIEVDGNTLNQAIKAAQAAAEAADDKAAGVSTTVNTLIGNDTGMSVRAIAGDVAGEVESDLLGPENADVTSATIRGNRKAVDKINTTLFGKTNPTTTDKIKTSVLPDVILGQLKFGGTIGNTQSTMLNQNIQITPSANYSSQFNEKNPFVITTAFDASDKEGWYFIVAKPNLNAIGNFGWDPITGPTGIPQYQEFYEVGDWFLSIGSEWVKIDNTDAVVSVAGMHGDITTADLVTELSTKDDLNPSPLAKQSDITLKGVKVADASKEYISVAIEQPSKEAEITVETASMLDVIGSNMIGNDALATAKDVYNFIKARLSVKVVSSN